MAVIILSGFICPVLQAEQTETLNNDDILKMDFLTHFLLSPDGKITMYLVTQGNDLLPPDDNGTLRMIHTNTGKETVLTKPDESVISWDLSPDNSTVAYVGMTGSDGDKYLAFVDLSSGKIEKKNQVPKELPDGFLWAGSDNLAYLRANPNTPVNEKPGDVIILDKVPEPEILKSYEVATGGVTTARGGGGTLRDAWKEDLILTAGSYDFCQYCLLRDRIKTWHYIGNTLISVMR